MDPLVAVAPQAVTRDLVAAAASLEGATAAEMAAVAKDSVAAAAVAMAAGVTEAAAVAKDAATATAAVATEEAVGTAGECCSRNCIRDKTVPSN